MKIPGVFALVLVTSTSLATAEPRHLPDTARMSHEDKQEENNGRLSYKDDAPVDKVAPTNGDWVELATPTPASHGTEFLVVGKEQGEFAHLRFDASSGTVILRRVRVYYDDGKQKVVDLDKVLRAHHGAGSSASIDLGDPKSIDRIVVMTEPQTKGSYAVYGTGNDSGTSVARK
jgi:hypothetical protein